ncbi:MAG TPA: TonB C-terminal domain-containing protein [Longimicrobiales bacterium]|nr:TonB C-terminal domain-containing protein [Longimicrobiales bacterium]
MSSHPRRPGRRAIAASLVLHVGLVAGAWAAVRTDAQPVDMVVYRVDLVSPPPRVEGEPEAAVVAPEVVKPEEAQPEPEPEEAEPEPKPEPPRPTPPKPEAKAPPQPKAAEARPTEPKPAAGARPDPTSPGGADLNVKIEGEAFPDPGYLENVVLQLRRHFRWNEDARLAACVGFWIHRDGRVDRIEVVRGSGNFRFDLSARGAVEAAGGRDVFGPLPDAWPFDMLPVQFGFAPAGSTRDACPN